MRTEDQIERMAENWTWMRFNARTIEDMAYSTICSNCGREFDERRLQAVLKPAEELYFCDDGCEHEYKEEQRD